MSHSPERKEKNCLNCGTIVQGKYCHVCGQENIEPKESFWGMLLHFFYDITHFDGKFFSTIKVLFKNPGKLTTEYLAGRRATYLHPVRMYVFTSAFFFLIFFTFFKLKTPDFTGPIMNEEALKKLEQQAYKNAHTRLDSATINKSIGFFYNSIKPVKDTTDADRNGLRLGFGKDVNNYISVAEYDSIQKSLPFSKKHSWFRRIFTRKAIDLNVRYKGREDQLASDLFSRFLHMIPYLLFVSLPFYALFLKLIYVRKRKEFFYVDHGLFLIHLYIFTFLLLLVFFLLMKLGDRTNWNLFGFMQFLLILYGVLYTLFAMKKFYHQGWGKTIIKFILFNILCLACLCILFVLFFAVTVYQV